MDEYDEIQTLLTTFECILIQRILIHMKFLILKEELSYFRSLLGEEEEEEEEVGQDLTTLVNTLNYKGVIEHLSRNKHEVNDSLDMVIAKITGLEDGVLRQDWKMVSIFFSFGANPMYNCFSGTLDGVFQEEMETLIIRFFRVNDPIPGYIGLRHLLDENDSDCYGEAYLSILEVLHESEKFVICRDFGSILKHLELVEREFLYSTQDCKDYVKTILLCMQKAGLPKDLCVEIASYALLGKLESLIHNHAIRGLDLESNQICRSTIDVREF